MKTSIVLLSLLVAITGCEKKSEYATEVGPEKAYRIERLFSYEGCTVYSFQDVGRTIHYTNCKGSTIESQSCGKNCTEDTQTNTEIPE